MVIFLPKHLAQIGRVYECRVQFFCAVRQPPPVVALIGGLAPGVGVFFLPAIFRQEQGVEGIRKGVIRLFPIRINGALHVCIAQQKLAFYFVGHTYFLWSFCHLFFGGGVPVYLNVHQEFYVCVREIGPHDTTVYVDVGNVLLCVFHDLRAAVGQGTLCFVDHLRKSGGFLAEMRDLRRRVGRDTFFFAPASERFQFGVNFLCGQRLVVLGQMFFVLCNNGHFYISL